MGRLHDALHMRLSDKHKYILCPPCTNKLNVGSCLTVGLIYGMFSLLIYDQCINTQPI